MPYPELDRQRLSQIIEFAEVLSQHNDFEEIVRIVAQKLCLLLEAELTLILMVNPRTQHTVKTIIREGVEFKHPGYRSAQDLISGWLMKQNQLLLTSDIKIDPRFKQIDWDDLPIKSVMGAILKAEGAVIGSLILINKTAKSQFDNSDLSFMSKIAMVAAPYLRNVQKIRNYFEASLPEPVLLAKYEQHGLLGKSKSFVELLRSVEAAAHCDVRVLLEGRSGTGKELIARAIHHFSERKDKPFVAVDCAAIPSHLMESEFFGHVKGAFTGAMVERDGLLKEADQGTLFLDEISSLPIEMQAKLMRVLQEGEVRPVGSNKVQRVDVRIISASSRSIRELVEERKFREDLFYRIYVYPIYVPSLGDRYEDIGLLANHFMQRFARQQNKPLETFEAQMVDFIKKRSWPGNIRELENLVERLVTLAPRGAKLIGKSILPADLQKEMRNLQYVYGSDAGGKSLAIIVDEFEEKLIRQALDKHNWNQSRAARSLKTPIQTFRSKMKRLGIEKPG